MSAMNASTSAPTQPTATLSKMVNRRMLGLSLHGWENWMVTFLIIAGLFALAAGFATWAVVRLQRIELAESAKEFERYKISAAKDVAEANERAENARLEQEKLKQ